MFERSVIFQSNSLPKPPFIKYSWDPFSPGTPSPHLSPKNQSGSAACSNASCVFGSLGLPSPPPASPCFPALPISSQGRSSDGWGCTSKGIRGGKGLSTMGQGSEGSDPVPSHPVLSSVVSQLSFAFVVDELPARAFDSGPAANGSVTEAAASPRQRHSEPSQGAWLLAWEWGCKSVPVPQLLPVLPFTRGPGPAAPSSPVPVWGSRLSPCLPLGLELSGWKGNGGQGSRGAARSGSSPIWMS